MPRKPTPKQPSYRRQKRHDRADLAFVEIKGQRLYLGEYDTPESHEAYERLMAEWWSNGRRLPARSTALPGAGVADDADKITIAELHEAFWQHVQKRYGPGERWSYKSALRLVTDLYGSTPADEFGPVRLRVVRDRMKAQGWNRTHINAQVSRIRSMFRWGISHEHIPERIYGALRSVESLKAGEAPRDGRKVKPAPRYLIRSVRPYLPRPVRALIDLQLLTGARSDELLRLQASDIDMRNVVWQYRPESHKAAHHGKDRVIYFGPRAQRILQLFIQSGRDITAPLFCPRDSLKEQAEACRTHRSRKAAWPRRSIASRD